jgi:hypothetical protein
MAFGLLLLLELIYSFLLGFLTHEDGTDRLFRNVFKELALLPA